MKSTYSEKVDHFEKSYQQRPELRQHDIAPIITQMTVQYDDSNDCLIVNQGESDEVNEIVKKLRVHSVTVKHDVTNLISELTVTATDLFSFGET